MKRYAWLAAAVGVFFATGLTVYGASRYVASSSQAAVEAAEARPLIPAYYRQGGPRHWRDCLGQN